MVALTKEMASRQAKEIFSKKGKNEKGTAIMMCTRCEHIKEKDRGSFWSVMDPTGFTKAKEHLAVHCPGIRPALYSDDWNLRHVLLTIVCRKNTSNA